MTVFSQRSFTGGEVAPALYARVDTNKYATGLRTCKNFFVMRHGGVSNRPGSQFVSEVKTSSLAVRLIPFVFNADQTYMLEFGNEYMRVIRSGAHETSGNKTITGITTTNPGVFTSNAHGYTNGQEIVISGIAGMPLLNNRNFKVTGVTANTFTLTYMGGTVVDTTSMPAFPNNAQTSLIYEIPTPYLAADLSTLQFVQSADVVTIVHPNYAPRELSRTAHTSWALSTLSFAPAITAPTGVAVSGAAGTADYWVVTAIMDETYEESLASSAVGASTVASSGSARTISWSAVTGAIEYNVYKAKNGIYGYIGTAVSLSYIDNGIIADVTESHPRSRNPFPGVNDYPSTVAYIQQRLTFANTINDPEKIWTSRTGQFKNFTTSSPLQDDDAVTWTMAGRQVNAVRHLLDIGQLVIFTSSGEWTVGGDAAGVIKPGEINPKQQTYNGSSTLPPIVAGGNALYVQSRGSVVRDLGFDYQSDGYRGNDLTIFSTHLFDGFTLADWTYQQIPHSVIWGVRSDGVLLGCTYVREQQILAWHRHDLGGVVENVCAIPEGDEDAVYLVVRRTVNARTVRYIERMNRRLVDDIKDSVFMDSALTYDGRNTNASHTLTISGGTTWAHSETLNITSSAAGYFSASDVGNSYEFTDLNGDVLRMEVTVYDSPTSISGRPHKTVPTTLRTVATPLWTRQVDQLLGLHHLEGKMVSILADGFVVANPNNEAYVQRTILNGALTLDGVYGVIHVGLPFTSDLETLNIDTAEGETLVDKRKLITKVNIFTEDSRGLWSGPNPPQDETTDFLGGLIESKPRTGDEEYDDPVALLTENIELNITPTWNDNGRVFIRQTDPLPLSILAIAPAGMVPVRGGQ